MEGERIWIERDRIRMEYGWNMGRIWVEYG
jgi:hypothetical protein